jgi:hypothetical protein
VVFAIITRFNFFIHPGSTSLPNLNSPHMPKKIKMLRDTQSIIKIFLKCQAFSLQLSIPIFFFIPVKLEQTEPLRNQSQDC